MRDILPAAVINILRDRYAAGVANAEAIFDQHRGDEDAVTGALGQALAIGEPIRFQLESQKYEIDISYRKIRGRGPRAPERVYGSDGIFQIRVKDKTGQIVAQKGLPFQSKMNWKGKDSSLLKQIKTMEETTPGGIVIDFALTGYKACTAKAAMAASGNRRSVEKFGAVQPLGQVLSRDFLDCTVGRRGLFYDADKESYGQLFPVDYKLLHVVTTEVVVRPWG